MPLLNFEEMDFENPFDWEFDSTCLASGTYNPITQTLTLVFNQRGTYEYYGVPLTVVIGLIH